MKCSDFKGGYCPTRGVTCSVKYCQHCPKASFEAPPPVTQRCGTVSVIIPVDLSENPDHLRRTIESLFETTEMQLDVHVAFDGPDPGWRTKYQHVRYSSDPVRVGPRVLYNRCLERCSGDWVFRVDSHCGMSQEWAERLVERCGPKDVMVCVLDGIVQSTWEREGKAFTFVRVDPGGQCQWHLGQKPLTKCNIIEPMASLMGCGWLARTDFVRSFGGFDPSLGIWGLEGQELSGKMCRAGGSIYLRTDVVCGHVFKKVFPYTVPDFAAMSKVILQRYARETWELSRRFPHADWDRYQSYEEYAAEVFGDGVKPRPAKVCCGKLVKLGAIAHGGAAVMLEKFFDLPALSCPQSNERHRICLACPAATWWTKLDVLAWLARHPVDIAKNLADLTVLPDLEIHPYTAGKKLLCAKCKCWIPAKTRVESERCPAGKW